MHAVNIHEAKTQLSKLIKAAEAGEEIIIARAGRPVARLVVLKTVPAQRQPGALCGRIHMSADFDTPLEETALFSDKR